MPYTGDFVAQTRRQLEAEIRELRKELESAYLRRDDDEIMELQRDLKRSKCQLASLNMCFD